MQHLSLTVIVVTMDRPECVERCLRALGEQHRQVDQVIVVDGSAAEEPRSRNEAAVAAYPGPGAAIYLRNEAGYGHMTLSRNIGLAAARGEVIAFLDDDAFAQPDWAQRLLETYERRPEAAGVGGRVLRDLSQLDDPIEHGPVKIGVLRRDGMIGGAWSVDCGRELDVEHLMGCNMSFRKTVLAELGGMRDEYPGPEVREETDLCLRVRRLGRTLVYNPKAVVLHLGAPKSKGKRFDLSYEYFGRHNHAYMLVRNFGFAPMLWRYLLSSVGMDLRTYAAHAWRTRGKTLPAAGWGLIVIHAGKVVGLGRGGRRRWREGLDPVRRDVTGRRITEHLNQSTAAGGQPSAPTASTSPEALRV